MTDLLHALNDLAGAVFLLSSFAMVATRQVRGDLNFFVVQSVSLAASALLIGALEGQQDLFIVAGVTVITKPIVIPILLRRMVPDEVHTRREIVQALNVPTSLLVALGLAVACYFAGKALSTAMIGPELLGNLPIGMAGLVIGALTIAVRREAVPQRLGLLAMENGAFFAGIVLAPGLPMIAELAAAFDVIIITVVVALLTRAIHERVGSTEVGSLKTLTEEERK